MWISWILAAIAQDTVLKLDFLACCLSRSQVIFPTRGMNFQNLNFDYVEPPRCACLNRVNLEVVELLQAVGLFSRLLFARL